MDLSLIVSQTKTAIDIAKYIKNSKDTLNQSEQKLKLAELIEALAEIKMETAEIKSLIIEKDEKIQLLENRLKLKNDLVYEAPYYWIKNSSDEKEGPFCQKCYDTDEKRIRLQKFGSNDQWECHSCKTVFKGKGYKKPKLLVSSSSIYL